MTSGIVVCRILLATDQELGVEELPICAGPDFVDRGRIEIDKNGTGNVFVAAGFVEEGLKGARVAHLGIGIGTTIGLQAVLEKVPGCDISSRSERAVGASGAYNSQAALPS